MSFPTRSSAGLFAALCLSLSGRADASVSVPHASVSAKIRAVQQSAPALHESSDYSNVIRAGFRCFAGYWRNC